jgi:DNA repair protein RecO (recombination protein O)
VLTGDRALPATYTTILSASYFAELCDLLTETMHPVPEIFHLLQRAWGFLRMQAPTQRAIEHFETELARALGIYDPATPAHHSLSAMAHKSPPNRALLMAQLGMPS